MNKKKIRLEINKKYKEIEFVVCDICHCLVDRYYVIQKNTCHYNPANDDLECWKFTCKRCRNEKKLL